MVTAVLTVLAIVAAIVWQTQRATTDQEFATVARGAIDVTIQTVGSVQATGAESTRSDIGGVIASLGVGAGDTVVIGDIVAVLERDPFEAEVTSALQRVAEAEYGLQFAESRAEEDGEDNTLRLEVLEAAERVQTARLSLLQARTHLSQSIVTASVAGTVIEIQLREGDAVGTGQSVVRISSRDDLRLIADIDELDLPNVTIGADARFRLDSFPATELTGNVISTAPQARQQGGATVFATSVEFEVPTDLDIRPGMNADVTIVTDARDGVLLVPEGALTTIGDRVFVEVLVNDDLEEREITLGYRGNGEVEVVDGLMEGDQILLH